MKAVRHPLKCLCMHAGISGLAALKPLRRLSLNCTRITGMGLAALCDLSELQILSLSGCKHIGRQGEILTLHEQIVSSSCRECLGLHARLVVC